MSRTNHPVFARIYAKRSVTEAHLQAANRRELLDGLSGRVLEVGCGNGLNFAHYPPGVIEVVGIEPERYLRDQARIASSAVDRPITVLEGEAETASGVVTGPFDAAVFSLVLCSVPDQRRVLEETKKVLRPGAAVRFYEHVVSDRPATARWQRLLGPLWSAVAGGCRPDRDTLSVIREEFEITDTRRFDFCPGCRVPFGIVAPHLLARGLFRSD